MQVLGWVSHGSLKVMPAESANDYFKIYLKLKDDMTGWGEDASISKLYEDLGVARDRASAQRLVERFVRPHIGTHETFETFEFTEMVA